MMLEEKGKLSLETLERLTLVVRRQDKISKIRILSAISNGGGFFDETNATIVELDSFEALLLKALIEDESVICVFKDTLTRAEKLGLQIGPMQGTHPSSQYAYAYLPRVRG